MSFFELFDQFFQLNAQQVIPPLASKLYMYWLHEFNKARWPTLLYRRANQVYTDLGCDKNTFVRAVAQLEARGLLSFESNSRTWELNYGPAADWLAGVVKNSPQTPKIMVNNSPSKDTLSDEKLFPVVKNSPPIRNRQDIVLEENQPTKKNGGGLSEEITLASLPAKKEVTAPRCDAPPVAAALPEALAAEAKALANQIGQLWHISEMKNQPKWARIHTFTRRLAVLGRLPEVHEQFAGYRLQREKAGLRPHQLDSWLGKPADDFADGEWCGCDWPAVAATTRTRGSDGATLLAIPARATASPSKAKPSWR